MGQVNEIRLRPWARVAHLLLIQGVPWAWTDEPELAADGWWTHDDRRILQGLAVPQTLETSLDLQSGLIEENSADFKIEDHDGTVPSFFGGLQKPFKLLGQRIKPTDDPAPNVPDAYGETLVLSEGGYLGTEAIGPSGERNIYSHAPWAGLPGQDHPAFAEPLPVFTTYETGPLIVEGRRVALYRIWWDPDTEEWTTFEDNVTAAQEEDRNPMFWFGVLRQAGTIDGLSWQINCSGPGSLLRRSAASRAPTKWFPVSAAPTLLPSESKVGIGFTKATYTGLVRVNGFDNVSYTLPSALPGDIAAYLSTAITATAGLAGANGEFDDQDGVIGGDSEGVVSFSAVSASVNISTLGSCTACARLHLTLHSMAWKILGYDPYVNDFEGTQPYFIPAPNLGENYYTGVFSNVPKGMHPLSPDGADAWDGNGIPRDFYPPYGFGALSIISGLGDQQVALETPDAEPLYCEGQIIRPRPIGFVDGEPTDSWRLWVFKGPIMYPGQDAAETIQVALCSYVTDGNGGVEFDASGYARGLHIHQWQDPRIYGINHPPLLVGIGWASNANASDDNKVVASPLSLLGLYRRQPDKVVDTIVRTLVSTGTSSWDPGLVDVGDDGILLYEVGNFTEGSNSTGLAYPAQDAEIYDLSLQIPASMVDMGSFAVVAEDLPGGSLGPLALGKVALQGTSLQSEDLFGALLSPRGWCFSMKKGRIGLFAPHKGSEGKFEEGIDFEIGTSDKAGEAGEPDSVVPTVELRPVFPFDRETLSYTGDPLSGWLSGQNEYKGKARDPGARARSGTCTRDIQGYDLISREWWNASFGLKIEPDTIKDWRNDFKRLWEIDIAKWLAQPHRLIEGLRISRPKGQDIFPGAILRLTDPWPANSTGTYGVTGAYARVISVRHYTDSCECEVTALLEAAPPNALQWGPILKVLDDVEDSIERYDPDSSKFYVESWGGTAPPLSAFVKPQTVDAPDEPAKVLVLQYDGVEWKQLANFLVESVNTVEGSIQHTAAGLTGNWYPRRHALLVLAPASDSEQAEWAKMLYAQHTSLPAANTTPKLPE